MRKRYCINLDCCVLVPLVPSLGWNAFLLMMVIFALIGAAVRSDDPNYLAHWASNVPLWMIISSPASIAASLLISAFLVLFPVSYIELGDESLRVHRPFEKDVKVRYGDIKYVRIKPKLAGEWAVSLVAGANGCETITVEIRKSYPCPSVWLSASSRTYREIAGRFKSWAAKETRMAEGANFVARADWAEEHGSPESVEWASSHKRTRK